VTDRKPDVALPSLVGPDGKSLYPRVELRDQAITYATRPGETFTADPEQMFMAMARRKRDGASDRAIFDEFDIRPGVLDVTWDLYRHAIRLGMQLLDEAIAAGEVPAETMVPVLVFDGEEDDG
jgi:hypothetical protein